MTKQELLSQISKSTGFNSKDVQKILKSFQEVILGELKKENSVSVLEFGSFKVAERAARTGVNPKTKQKIQIPAKKVPRLSSSRKLKEFVSGLVGLDAFNF